MDIRLVWGRSDQLLQCLEERLPAECQHPLALHNAWRLLCVAIPAAARRRSAELDSNSTEHVYEVVRKGAYRLYDDPLDLQESRRVYLSFHVL